MSGAKGQLLVGGGAQPARAPYVAAVGELVGELAGLGSAWLPAAGRWLKTWGLGC